MDTAPPRGFASVWSLWLAASLIAGLSFWPAMDWGLPLPARIAWKGAGVALLAVHGWARGQEPDRRWLAAIMALGALGDMGIELSQTLGAAFFLVGHLVAIRFYWRHRAARPGILLWIGAVLVLLAVPAAGWVLPCYPGDRPATLLYATTLAGMTASALLSRFPRGLVGFGALMFAASDLLIFARMGPLAFSPLPHLLIWPLYYAGQALITLGVLAGPRPR